MITITPTADDETAAQTFDVAAYGGTRPANVRASGTFGGSTEVKLQSAAPGSSTYVDEPGCVFSAAGKITAALTRGCSVRGFVTNFSGSSNLVLTVE